MNKRRHKKPTGKIHPIEFSDGLVKIAPDRFKIPEIKSEIEEKIAKYFLKIAGKYNMHPFTEKFELISNDENDLDFSLHGKNSQFLLELTEITPPGKMKGGYKGLSTKLNARDHSIKIIKLILKKSKKYIGIKSKIILLMYTTDFRSHPGEYTQMIVKDFLNKVPLNFEMIFEIVPSLEQDGFLTQYYPNNQSKLSDSMLESLKRTYTVLFKPNL